MSSIPILDAAKALKGVAEASSRTSDARTQALSAATLAMQADSIASSATSLANGANPGIKVSVSLGNTKSESSSEQLQSTAVGSSVSGNNVSVKATGAGNDSNVVITGSTITAKDTATLSADGKVILQAAKNTAEQHSTNQSSGASIGIGFAAGGTQNGFTLDIGANKSKGNADGSDLSWSSTHVNANTVDLKSGGDTEIKGAVIAANTVKADIGGDLKIESLQDKSTYDAKQKSSSVGVSLCIPPFCYGDPGLTSASISAGRTNISSTYESVTEQSGIRAGDGGFQIKAQGKTDLQGGAITSTQKAVVDGKNSFESDGGITTSDIRNTARYNADGFSISAGVGEGNDRKGNSLPTGSAGIGSDSGSTTSVTKASISGIAGDKSARTGDAPTSLKKIFDEKKVREEVNAQVEITAAFGQNAAKAIGDYAQRQLNDANALRTKADGQTDPAARDSLNAQAKALEDAWGVNGTSRLLAHAIVGGLTGGLGGAAGAAAGTLTGPAVAQALSQAGVDGALAQALTALVATGAGAVLGGTAGGGAALNEVTNNYLTHNEIKAKDQKLKRCSANGDTACEAKVLKEYDLKSAANSGDINYNSVLTLGSLQAEKTQLELSLNDSTLSDESKAQTRRSINELNTAINVIQRTPVINDALQLGFALADLALLGELAAAKALTTTFVRDMLMARTGKEISADSATAIANNLDREAELLRIPALSGQSLTTGGGIFGSPRDLNPSALGELIGRGGNKNVYAYGNSQVVAVLQPGKPAQLIGDEIVMLSQLNDLGIPALNARGITVNGQPAMLMDQFAQGSKSIVALQNGRVRIVGDSPLLNTDSVRDLQNIRAAMVSNNVQINDLQFLISNEGRVVVADPLKVNLNTAPSKNNLRMIDLLIESAKKNGPF